jgi:hypothetical protein
MVTYLKNCPDFIFNIDEERMSSTRTPKAGVRSHWQEVCDGTDGGPHQEAIREKESKKKV